MTEDNLVQSSAPVIEQPAERMVPQSEVDKVVGAVKHSAYEKAKQELMMQQQANPQGAQLEAQGALSKEAIEAMILEKTQALQMQQARQLEAERVVGEFVSKMDMGKTEYEDFEDTVKDVDFSEIPGIVKLSNEMPNTHDIWYELAKNPYKIGNLELLLSKSPALARKEMMRLSASIEENKKARSQVSAREPLSQMKPSSNTSVDSSKMTLADMKRQPWARG